MWPSGRSNQLSSCPIIFLKFSRIDKEITQTHNSSSFFENQYLLDVSEDNVEALFKFLPKKPRCSVSFKNCCTNFYKTFFQDRLLPELLPEISEKTILVYDTLTLFQDKLNSFLSFSPEEEPEL